ncbi:hypothetical protein QBC34DRAFT_303031 [Podospora aff. communis PSN243]|uniref:F-box domain-containing protein n=1 Tax=Podospora aff. communis PSN243 TaxID=3040156 RepID=A0AAV9GGG3_9PEZI|nr:hypothetical protein QBC34DRAFT_303031 [Podospora aff. communis PSN243]
MTDVAPRERPRSSIDKKPVIMADATPAFERLPDEIIEQILEATDSNGFASLALLNSKWRSVAQQAHLYAHHLSNCPSYSMSHPPVRTPVSADDLPKLRRLFAREVKRNLFEAYLRPRKTVIKIISNSISSSSCPGGEGIQFSPSPKGHHLLAYNSSRIYLVDARGRDPAVKREFKILRRPAATCINDNGSMLAVLLTEMQVDIYDLGSVPPKRSQSLILDHSPRAIALSPCGTVLAAAYEGGIEVSSLSGSALSSDRRAVKCDAVDALSFSFDGTQILGTTVHALQPNTVILTAPYYDPGSHMAEDNMSALWTTSILFPNTSRDCSHAVLIQNGKYDEAAWTFTYDRSFETFRAVRIDDLRNGTTYFTGPLPSPTSQAKLLPCTLPAASYNGELVSAGFQGKDIWLYGVPEDLDAVPDTSSGSDSGSNAANILRRSSSRSVTRSQENIDSARVPQWQLICDKLRNTFIGGYKIGELEGVNMVKWVAGYGNSATKERLVIAARNVTPGLSILDDEGMDFVDGGRVTLIDFDYTTQNGEESELIVDVGTKEPEVLEEEHRDMATEVAIVRRRTVAQQRGGRGPVRRAATTAAPRAPALPTQASSQEKNDDDDDPLLPRRIGAVPPRVVEPEEDHEEMEGPSIEEQEALDAPYAHASPRSGNTLRRAATAAAANRRLRPPPAAAGAVEYRRADGRTEHPHESDADNWVPPPPPYQKEDPGDLPAFLRHALPTGGASGSDGTRAQPQQPAPSSQSNTNVQTPAQQQPRRSQTTAPAHLQAPSSAIPPVPPLPRLSQVSQIPLQAPQAPWHRREGSTSSVHSAQSAQSAQSAPDRSLRPSSQSSRYLGGENIYDVSPPGSPALAPRRPERTSVYINDSRRASHATPDNRASMVVPTTVQQNTAVPPPRQLSSQHQLSALPRLQTAAPSHPAGAAPSLDLQIPSPSLQGIMQGFSNVPTVTGPGGRRLSSSMTWPTQPSQRNPAAATVGYPYSAPIANMETNSGIPHTYAVPQPHQASGYSNRTEPSARTSGIFQVPRVPVGSRAGEEHGAAPYSRPFSQQQQYSQGPQYRYEPRSNSQPQPHYAQHPPGLEIQTSQAQRMSEISPGTPREDIPLIISTPKGVTGAFDPPDRRISGRRVETPILAPVPRHPRPTAQAVLRPAAERLENIYNPAIGSSQNPNFLMAPPPPASGSGSSGVRVPSLNRKQSRAERSAAKNIADAKRRGWAGRSRSKSKRKKKQKERDLDAASSAAWTDVTTFSHRSLGFGRSGSSNGNAAGQQAKDKKCVVM